MKLSTTESSLMKPRVSSAILSLYAMASRAYFWPCRMSSDLSSAKSVKDAEPAKDVKPTTQQPEETATKKRRTNEGGDAVVTATASASREVSQTPAKGNDKKKGKQPREQGERFSRIKIDKVTFADERLRDNRFESRVRACFTWASQK